MSPGAILPKGGPEPPARVVVQRPAGIAQRRLAWAGEWFPIQP